MSPKQQRGEVTADLLLDAALRLFAEQGEQGLTVNAVTKASGVSLGSLYHHFGSLDGLVDALTERWLSRLLGELITALQATRTARTGIRAIVRTHLAFVREHRDAALLLHSARTDQRNMIQARELRDSQEARLSVFATWVQSHVDSGELAPLSPPLLESLVLGPLVGVVRRWLSGIDDVELDLDEAARVLPDRIWRSVAANPN
ncbi:MULTISPECIES: TetR/AcrR family transcriptional regulator [unclassified Streptomyces]|uniref:TetR/AcrR family transcriptional regulator n=1 Tax=unclassified Streptomyces TaxID=2593676 RepID=UPI0029620330|nr:TetR/AcrR family transcriptional regulator [Streptomyces sp. N50]WOX11684.1 TetR/AcrR family transcriptional regulator [Streptomyces sp. N50]